jgi:glycoprotein endo-alpha-1,2-mannosidase
VPLRRYGTPETDGAYKHWNHEVLPHWTEAVNRLHPVGRRFQPPRELHSPFYPLGGPYSSSDAGTVRRHMRQLRGAGVGVVVASWWGPAWRKGGTDTQARAALPPWHAGSRCEPPAAADVPLLCCPAAQGVSTDAVLPLLLRVAGEEGVRVALHLEPYPGRTAASVREDLLYLMSAVGDSPALLRVGPRRLPVYYGGACPQPPAAPGPAGGSPGKRWQVSRLFPSALGGAG